VLRLILHDKEFIAIQQRERSHMPLRNKPDLPLRIRQHKITLAGFGWVVHSENFVDEIRIEARILDRVRPGNQARFERNDFDEQPIVDVHDRSVSQSHTTGEEGIQMLLLAG
jgi:hypothetical protein